MKVIGLMIRLKVEELMSIWMELNTWVNGEKIANTDMESRVGQTMQNMKVITNMGKNMVLVLSNGAMVLKNLKRSSHLSLITFEQEFF